MKITTIIFSSVLIFFGLCAGIYALFEFNILFFLCFGNVTVYRSVLSVAAIAAGWLMFWLIAFRPTKYVS